MRLLPVCLALLGIAFAQDPQTALTDLARAMIAAPDDASRSALEASHADSLDSKLVAAIAVEGNARYAKSDYDGARAAYAIAIDLARRIDDGHGLAMGLSNTGAALMQQNREAEAMPLLDQALNGFHSLDDHHMQSRVLNNIGLIHLHANEFAAAEQSYRRALVEDHAQAAPDAPLITLHDLGNLYDFWGRYDLAAQSLNQALDLARKLNRERDVGAIQGTMAAVYFELRDYPLALSAAQESLAVKRRLNDHTRLSNMLDQIAEVEASLGHLDLAQGFLDQALAEAADQHDPASRANILYDYGALLWTHRHQGATAAAKFRESLAIATEAGRKSLSNHARAALAAIANAESQWAEAIEWSRPALDFGAQTDDPSLIEDAADALATAHEALHQDDDAERAWRECIAAIESQNEHIAAAEETEAQFMKDKQSPYKHLAALLEREGRIEQALSVTEMAKARVILETLRNGHVEIDRVLTPSERDRESALRARIATLRSGNTAQLARVRVDYRAFRNALYVEHPELRVHRLDLDSASPARMMAALPERDAALIEYSIEENSIRMFVVTGGATGVETRVYSIAANRAALSGQVARFTRQISTRDLGFRDLGQSLYRELIAPAATQLRGKRTLILVPDGFLWALPFQALLAARDRYLIEDHPLFYAPSLTVLDAMMRIAHGPSAPPSTLLAIGAVDAAGSRREIEGLRSLYGPRARIYQNADATSRRIREEAPHFDVLHISAHGIFRDDDPMSSYLMLGEERFEARDLLNVNLHARLVVLSGCETARGGEQSGEGLIGMSWALFVAGSPSTVASQFKVDADSTANLMLAFHRHLHQDGHAAGALREAALDTMRRAEFRHPFYWSGFIVLGQGF